MRLKLPLKIIYFVKKEGKIILVEWGLAKAIAHYESYGKTDQQIEHNIIEYYIYC